MTERPLYLRQPEPDRSDAYGYHTPPEQQDQLDARFKKVSRIAARPSSSDRYTVAEDRYSTPRDSSLNLVVKGDGKTIGDREVGNVRWDTQTGKVSWLGVNGGHRHMLPKLLAEAKAHADKNGYAPPSHSEDLTGYSYKLAKKYVPEHIPEDAHVNYRPVNLKNTDFHTATEHINKVHAMALAHATPKAHRDINVQAEAAKRELSNAHEIFTNTPIDKDKGENYSYHIGQAQHHTEQLGYHLPDKDGAPHPAAHAAISHFESMWGHH